MQQAQPIGVPRVFHIDQSLALKGHLGLHGRQFRFGHHSDVDHGLGFGQLLFGQVQALPDYLDLAQGQGVIPVGILHRGYQGFAKPLQFIQRDVRFQPGLAQHGQVDLAPEAAQQGLAHRHSQPAGMGCIVLKAGVGAGGGGLHGDQGAGGEKCVQCDESFIASAAGGVCAGGIARGGRAPAFVSLGEGAGRNHGVECGPGLILEALRNGGGDALHRQGAVVFKGHENGLGQGDLQLSAGLGAGRRRRRGEDLRGGRWLDQDRQRRHQQNGCKGAQAGAHQVVSLVRSSRRGVPAAWAVGKASAG